MRNGLLSLWRRVARKFRRSVMVPLHAASERFWIRYGWGPLPVLVYQVGKVGSSTIYYSLKAAGVNCEHVHRIVPENIERIAQERRNAGLPVKDERLGLALNDRLQRRRDKVRVVTMVREPVSRNISAFFQNLADYYGGDPLGSIPVDEAIRRFLDEYPHHVPIEWFDTEFARATGISVFDYPFPHADQWMKIIEGRFEILILRVEAPDRVKKEAVEAFLGIGEIDLVRTNVGEGKEYASLYNDFRRQVRLPEEYVDRLLNSTYSRHFYSGAELEEIRNSWIRKDGGVMPVPMGGSGTEDE